MMNPELNPPTQSLHAKVSLELALRIDEAILQHRRRTGERLTKSELLISWIEKCLEQDEV